ncbi:oxidoreductase-like protein [Cristinia sonorae]|uniref:Oxidoreductase-like protein n=1 Tax=Cristinia sonorae TaxID=1940300 RepID=A0A8K0USX2_9AGAR|nr:oxidoreductase-like protein [Cristinia sonorae]
MLRLSRQLTCHGNHSRKQIVSCCRTVISGQTYSTSPSILTISQTEVARKKHAVRGGQNLSSRYDRLEKSLRGKEGYDQRIADLKEEGSSLSSSGQTASVKKNTFMGFVIPEKPKPPADDECCMSGCAVCVYDLYDEALHDYNDKLSSLRTSLQVLNIPEFQWPLAVRTAPVDKVTDSKKSPTLSAFEELELRLKQKQEESLVSPPG